jgi:hypothetical protein
MSHLLHHLHTKFNCHVLDHKKSSSNSTTKWRSGRSTKKRTCCYASMCTNSYTSPINKFCTATCASYSRSGAHQIEAKARFEDHGNCKFLQHYKPLTPYLLFVSVYCLLLLTGTWVLFVDLILDIFCARRRYLVMAFYFIKLHDLKEIFSVVLAGQREKLCSFWILFRSTFWLVHISEKVPEHQPCQSSHVDRATAALFGVNFVALSWLLSCLAEVLCTSGIVVVAGDGR